MSQTGDDSICFCSMQIKTKRIIEINVPKCASHRFVTHRWPVLPQAPQFRNHLCVAQSKGAGLTVDPADTRGTVLTVGEQLEEKLPEVARA